MCGIAGIALLNGKTKPLHTDISHMTNRIAHRGPNDAGYAMFFGDHTVKTAGDKSTAQNSWQSFHAYSPKSHIEELSSDANIAFGHRRLSVIDTSPGGHQPMCSIDQQLWVVFNGELYNYIELRSELETAGYVFQTKSDTEVLINAYLQWGSSCLSHFNGMWSFVIYDKRRRILFGARDRSGVKPFYYTLQDDVFCFASEIKAFMDLPYVDKTVNDVSIAQYLALGVVENNGGTFFSSIRELEPSHSFVLDVTNGKFEISKYFELQVLNNFERFNSFNANNYAVELKEYLFDAVYKRLRSDIPVGFCLSGGIDSSSIVSIANTLRERGVGKSTGERMIGFTSVNGIPGVDEKHWAELVTKHYGMEWHTTSCTSQDMISMLPDMVYYQDSPLISTSTYAQFKVMQLADSHNIRVLIDGQGSDEMFAGYNYFYPSFYLELLKHGALNSLASELVNTKNGSFTMSQLIKAWGKLTMDKVLPNNRKIATLKKVHPEISFINGDYEHHLFEQWNYSAPYSSLPTNDLLSQSFFGYNLKNLLRWEDRCSMKYSVESRTPFADDLPLMEYTATIPSVYKIHKGTNKAVLREALKDILPTAIYNRKDKLGFSTPEMIWLNELEPQLFQSIQASSSIGFIDKQKLLKYWSKSFKNNNIGFLRFIFRYYNLLLWQNSFKTSL
jgi:asparagine synthase (glutamine-hydrolysing)